MCGICVAWDSSIDIGTAERMTACLRHRGPDNDDTIQVGPDLFFGHTRLAIIDLSPDANQPLRRRDGGPVVTFNGEIYNFAAIRRELAEAGEWFATKSDTEVLLAGYERWGPGVLDRLRGMFAFAIYDPGSAEVFVARDRLGMKPLFWYEDSNRFLCASELKALLRHPCVSRRLDVSSIREYLLRGYITAPNTVLEEVHKLPAGCYLRYRSGSPAEVVRYWNPADFYGAASGVTAGAAVEQLDQLLNEAVQYRMIADVPVGGLLSGGVDSALVVALMQESRSKPVLTFTIGFDDHACNEALHARGVATYLGTDHHEIEVTEGNLLELIEELPNYYDEPFADASAIPTLALSRLARRHVTVALSGDGGDETHLGYRTYHWLRRREVVRGLLSEELAALGGRGLSLLPHRRAKRIGSYLTAPSPAAAHASAGAYWDGNEPRSLLLDATHDRFGTFEQLFSRHDELELEQRAAAADLGTYLVDDVLTKVDRASMAVALEVRVPLLDHHVVEYTLGLPAHLKWGRRGDKPLLRELLYRRVPRELVDRPKHGFNVPMRRWLTGPLRTLASDLLAPDRLRRQRLFSDSAVSDVWREHLRGHDRAKRIWNMVAFQLWYQHYIEH